MILSSTGFTQSMVKVAPFFLPLGPTAAPPLLIVSPCSATLSKNKFKIEGLRRREGKEKLGLGLMYVKFWLSRNEPDPRSFLVRVF